MQFIYLLTSFWASVWKTEYIDLMRKYIRQKCKKCFFMLFLFIYDGYHHLLSLYDMLCGNVRIVNVRLCKQNNVMLFETAWQFYDFKSIKWAWTKIDFLVLFFLLPIMGEVRTNFSLSHCVHMAALHTSLFSFEVLLRIYSMKGFGNPCLKCRRAVS